MVCGGHGDNTGRWTEKHRTLEAVNKNQTSNSKLKCGCHKGMGVESWGWSRHYMAW